VCCVCDRNSYDLNALKVPVFGVSALYTLQLNRCSVDRPKSTRPVHQSLKALYWQVYSIAKKLLAVPSAHSIAVPSV